MVVLLPRQENVLNVNVTPEHETMLSPLSPRVQSGPIILAFT